MNEVDRFTLAGLFSVLTLGNNIVVKVLILFPIGIIRSHQINMAVHLVLKMNSTAIYSNAIMISWYGLLGGKLKDTEKLVKKQSDYLQKYWKCLLVVQLQAFLCLGTDE